MGYGIGGTVAPDNFVMKNSILTVAAILSSLFLASCATTGTNGNKEAVKPYPLDKCIVMDVPLGKMGKPKVKVYKGQEMKFCCIRCVKAFNANPDFYLDKLARETAPADAVTTTGGTTPPE